VGACHPNFLGEIVEVTRVDVDNNYAETKHIENGEELFTGGELGGLEPIIPLVRSMVK
jgi:hypothetical protein